MHEENHKIMMKENPQVLHTSKTIKYRRKKKTQQDTEVARRPTLGTEDWRLQEMDLTHHYREHPVKII